MEYKIRHVHKKKANKIKNRAASGFTRVKVRGRKRWVKPAQPSDEKRA